MRTLALLCSLAVVSVAVQVEGEEVAAGVLRTPDDRFVGLEDFPFQPHYMQIGSTASTIWMKGRLTRLRSC